MCVSGKGQIVTSGNHCIYAVFAIRSLAFSAQQCVFFVAESTSDGLVFKTMTSACTSCL